MTILLYAIITKIPMSKLLVSKIKFSATCTKLNSDPKEIYVPPCLHYNQNNKLCFILPVTDMVLINLSFNKSDRDEVSTE